MHRRRATLTDADDRTVAVAERLARALQARGAADEAEEMYRLAVDGRRAVHGATHPLTLGAVTDLVHLLHESSPKEAVALSWKAHSACRAAGADAYRQPAALDVGFNLAVMLHEARDFVNAGRLYSHVLRERTAVLGAEHEDTRSAGNYRSRLMLDWEDAVRADLAAAAGSVTTRSVEAVEAAADCVEAMRCRGLISDAGALGRDVLARAREMLGEEHITTLRCTMLLGSVFTDDGDGDGAEPLFRVALDKLRAALGPDDLKTLDAGNELAWCLHSRAGCAAEAVDVARATACGFEAALGAAHGDTLNALDTLAAALLAAGLADEEAAVRLDIAAR